METPDDDEYLGWSTEREREVQRPLFGSRSPEASRTMAYTESTVNVDRSRKTSRSRLLHFGELEPCALRSRLSRQLATSHGGLLRNDIDYHFPLHPTPTNLTSQIVMRTIDLAVLAQ